MKFTHRDIRIIRSIEKRKLYVISRVEIFAVQEIGDEHLEKDAVGYDTCLAGMLIGKVCKRTSRAVSEVFEIFLV